MSTRTYFRSAAKWTGLSLGIGAASYATYAAKAWLRYGKPKKAPANDVDAVLDLFMSRYEVGDRHTIRIDAPPEVALSAAREMDLESCAVVRAIFKGREWILRSKPDDGVRPRGLVEGMKALGWGVLAELPGREVVMGGVTQPWDPNPVFRALPLDQFAEFNDPGYVKIAGRCEPIRPEMASPFFAPKHVRSPRILNRARSSGATGRFSRLELSRFAAPCCRS